jgi:hypothetical protein
MGTLREEATPPPKTSFLSLPRISHRGTMLNKWSNGYKAGIENSRGSALSAGTARSLSFDFSDFSFVLGVSAASPCLGREG